jgi:tetratricopeptide (TPR) repeat protein
MTGRPTDCLAASILQAANLVQQGQWQRAEEILAQVLAENRGEPDGLQLLGLVREHQGKLEEAQSLLRHSLASRPNQAHVQVHLGRTINGIELDYSQPFDFLLEQYGLPGFGITSNVTIIDQKSSGALPAIAGGVSPLTYNATAYYDHNGAMIRFSYTWTTNPTPRAPRAALWGFAFPALPPKAPAVRRGPTSSTRYVVQLPALQFVGRYPRRSGDDLQYPEPHQIQAAHL